MSQIAFQKKNSELQVHCDLPVNFIEEDRSVIAYTPALDLSTCGKSRKDAQKMFEEAVQIFFEDLIENNIVDEVLTGLGWKKNQVKSNWIPPKISQESIGVKIPLLT